MAESRNSALFYNERFSFSDPLSKISCSRSTRYRHKRLRTRSCNAQEPQGLPVQEETEHPIHKGLDTSGHHEILTDNLYESADNESYETPFGSLEADLDDQPDCNKLHYGSDSDSSNEDEHEVASEQEALIQTDPFQSEHPICALEEADTSLSQPCHGSPLRHIYNGSRLTVEGSLTLLMQYKVRHNLTYRALGDLLKLLKLHCPTPSFIPTSLYEFKKHFNQLGNTAVIHHYCSYCLSNIPTPEQEICENPYCKADLTNFSNLSSFIEVSLDDQLATFCKSNIINI